MESSQVAGLVMRIIGPMVNRIYMMISRGVVQLVYDNLKMQNVQIALVDGELTDNVENFQPYGFTSQAQPGAEGIFLSVGAVRGAGVVLCVADRTVRPMNMNKGDVALHHLGGIRVYLDNTNDVVNLGGGTGAQGIGAATDFVALATAVQNRLAALENFCASLSSSDPIATSMGPAMPTSPFVANTSVVAATKVKAT